MNYHNFESLFGSQKVPIGPAKGMDSFSIAPPRSEPYIEPDFSKSVFDTEKPQVLLVSAVGATGKSALAKVLSSRLTLPLLDLARHKPVGANTLTGQLTNAFSVQQLSPVFQGISTGTYGIIVDGIDEGRSKTTEQAFNAFLDDIVQLCGQSKLPSFLLLGRTQILEECWLYLAAKGVSTGLLTIDPFDLTQARTYIDRFSGGLNSPQSAQYMEARDAILDKLSRAFSNNQADQSGNFLSFIGYPPVLDAIVTLLNEERNYHRLRDRLGDSSSNNVEIELLYRIARYILEREKSEKVIPNIVAPLLASLPPGHPAASIVDIFSFEEQCIRLVSHCTDQLATLSCIKDPVLNARYEEQLAIFLPEHPFVTGKEFRNAIFEAVALAVLISSSDASHHDLALRYIDTHRHSYYLIYLLALIAPEGRVPLSCIKALLGAALEFKATNASVELQLIGSENEEAEISDLVEVQVELTIGTGAGRSKIFQFQCPWLPGAIVELGPRLGSAYVSLPGEVALGGSREIELTAPVELAAQRISLRSPTLTLRIQNVPGSEQSTSKTENYILLEAELLVSDVTSLGGAGMDFTIAVEDVSSLHYPLVQHAQRRARPLDDPDLQEKYLRLRKILTHFRSHSKGALAKYRDKVENPRVAGNRVGAAVLQQLVSDRVLILDGSMYFLDPGRVDSLLGTSWNDLRKGIRSDKLLGYLKSIAT